MSSIDQLKSLVSRKDGIARPNVFRVKLPSIPGATSEEVNLLCKDVVLPGKQIVTNERRVGMQVQKVPYGYAVTDISMTFQVLNDYGIRKYFDVWQSIAVDQDGQTAGYLRGREGYGKQIVEHCVAVAKANNCYKVKLNCEDSLISFYGCLGFEHHGAHMYQ